MKNHPSTSRPLSCLALAVPVMAGAQGDGGLPCRYTGIRQAERVGCLLGPEDTLAVVGLGRAVAARRRGREGR